MIKITDFSKTYPNGFKAVDNINLEIKPGDLFAFIGHNGAGKTTTIKCMVGLLPISNGSISFDGVSISDDPICCKRQLAYLPDNPDLYENITGNDYLNLIGNVFKVPAAKRQEKVLELANDFGLLKDLNSYIVTYSHGMRQKLALIGAFLHEPKFMILDEPFVGLDPKAAFVVKSKMQQMCDNGGAIFFSTHVLEVAQKLCNKIAIIKNGKLLRSGLMDEVIGDKSLESVFLELIDHE